MPTRVCCPPRRPGPRRTRVPGPGARVSGTLSRRSRGRLVMRGVYLSFACAAALVAAACQQQPAAPAGSAQSAAQAPAAAAPNLGIRPDGDTEIKPDMSQVPEELAKVYEHIDQNIDQHVVNLQKWIQQPSI